MLVSTSNWTKVIWIFGEPSQLPNALSSNTHSSRAVVRRHLLVETSRLLLKLFPTTFGVKIFPPFLTIRVCILPPHPWLFAVTGLLVHFTTDDFWGGGGRGRLWYNSICTIRMMFSDQILQSRPFVAEFRKFEHEHQSPRCPLALPDLGFLGGLSSLADGTDLNQTSSYRSACGHLQVLDSGFCYQWISTPSILFYRKSHAVV